MLKGDFSIEKVENKTSYNLHWNLQQTTELPVAAKVIMVLKSVPH